VTDILVARPVNDAIRLVLPTSSPGVAVLPAGPLPPNPSMLLGLPRLREMLHGLERNFDAVVVDTAPMSAGADTVAVVAAVEQVVVVVDARTTRRRRLAALREDLERSGAEILGIALNRVPGGVTPYVPDGDRDVPEAAPRSRARA
jgi:Mrp family chromosome partitioning ATPase